MLTMAWSQCASAAAWAPQEYLTGSAKRYMTTETQMERDYIKGGAFLIEDRAPAEVFTPEDFTDEHRMIAETTREFVDNEVRPNLEAMENHAWEVARELVQKAG